MHPFVRYLVIGVVAMIVAGALMAMALLGRNTQVSVWSLLVAGIIAIVTGALLFVESWIWSQRSWQSGYSGRSAAIAVAGGVAIVVAAGALAATVILVLTFGLG
jgi:uncharacterized membrane protein HdeD (DUF308 family)